MAATDERPQLIETAVKAMLVDDDSDTLALETPEWETDTAAVLIWRLFHVDDAAGDVEEARYYPALEIAINEPRRIHPHDPMFMQATGQVVCLTHHTRDKKQQVLSEITGIVRSRIEDRGRWSKLDLALPDYLGLGGLRIIPADVELNDSLYGNAWQIIIDLITTETDTPIATTTA